MHGLGNDFVLLNHLQQPFSLQQVDIIALADRHCGIGFDQLLVLKPSRSADLYCQIFNADGSEAEQCGNGMRCVARYVHEEQIIAKPNLSIETRARKVQLEIKDYDHIRTNMGQAQINPQILKIIVEGSSLELMLLSLGNPHAIYRAPSIKEIPVSQWGVQIEKQPAFSQGVNTGFMEVVNRQAIRLRTYERGVGETLACGSNACAAVVAGIRQTWLDSTVDVFAPGGKLLVEWKGGDSPVFLTGPAARVFKGELSF